MLLQAAANEWQVPVAELKVAAGVITHASSGRTTTYGKVATAAAKLPQPDYKSIQLKNPKDWKIAGKPLKRLDTLDKLNGQKKFGFDLQLPGMLHATVKDCPVYGGKLVSFDDAKVKTMPGVKQVLRVNATTVGVVADTWWRAKKALDALPIVWDEGPNAKVNSASIAEHLKSGLTSDDSFADTNTGDAINAIAGATKKIEAVYSVPFSGHAMMEPINCTVKLSADRAELWIPSQNADASIATLSTATGLPQTQCEVYIQDLGGGFGRGLGGPNSPAGVHVPLGIAQPVSDPISENGLKQPLADCGAGLDRSVGLAQNDFGVGVGGGVHVVFLFALRVGVRRILPKKKHQILGTNPRFAIFFLASSCPRPTITWCPKPVK
jgi:isoquinoline 1-oxidoreductase beta subunit